jgi:hypothetical protein
MNRFERRIASLTFSLLDITETGVAMAEFSVIGARRLPDQSSSRTLVSLPATPVTDWPKRFLPRLCHAARESHGSPRFAPPHRGTSEPTDITHKIAQGRATPDVFVSAVGQFESRWGRLETRRVQQLGRL